MIRLGVFFRRYFSGNLGRLAKERRGAITVEYALLALPFFTILFAIIETGYIFFAAILIEGATAEASRQIRTGAVQQAALPLPSSGISCAVTFLVSSLAAI
jgi:Flp pilus assembly protein TadG